MTWAFTATRLDLPCRREKSCARPLILRNQLLAIRPNRRNRRNLAVAVASMVYRTRLAARRGVLTCLSRGTGVQVGAIFDVRALLTPPLAAERMVQLSMTMGFRAEVLA